MDYPDRSIDRGQAAIYASDMLSRVLTIGEELLCSGAEISRVEDTISRICHAYGAERTEVLAITSSIVVTMYASPYGSVTQTRRIHESAYDLYRLELLNQLSRDICKNPPQELSVIDERLDEIAHAKHHSFWQLVGFYAVIAGPFTLLFGGTWQDAVAASIIGVALKPLQLLLTRIQANAFLKAVICSIFGGVAAGLFVRSGFAQNVDLIAIGDIMILIPGIALTNSLRDMFSGDTISGLLRFSEAVLLAVTIAFGFALSARWL